MLTRDPVDPNRFHTNEPSVSIGFHAVNTNNLPQLIVNGTDQTFLQMEVGGLNLLVSTFPLAGGNNVLAITLDFTGGSDGSPQGKYEAHEIVELFEQKLTFFLKGREESEPNSFFLIFERHSK